MGVGGVGCGGHLVAACGDRSEGVRVRRILRPASNRRFQFPGFVLELAGILRPVVQTRRLQRGDLVSNG